MTWFYAQNDEQKGPVSEDELKQLLASGEITTDNLVWKEGMGEWQSYGSVFGGASGNVTCPTCGTAVEPDLLIPTGDTKVCPNCRDTYAQGLKEGASLPVASSGRRGTGGQTPNPELRANAREALSGKWGLAALITFIFMILTQAVGIVPLLGPIAQLVITGPLIFGYQNYVLRLHRRETADIGLLFSGFSHFGISWLITFVAYLIIYLTALAAAIPGIVLIIIGVVMLENSGGTEANVLVGVGIFLAVVPAIIASIYMGLRYSMAMFLAVDDPEIRTMQALRKSTEMMNGHKMKLFMLGLSFIGWYFLGLLAFFIGIVFVMPYAATAFAAFYDDLGDGSTSV